MELPNHDPAGSRTALRRLVGFRFAVAGLVLVSVLGVRVFFDIAINWLPVGAGLFALLVVNGMLRWRIAGRRTVSEVELFANFVLEVLALTAILAFVGGSTSPLVSLYLLPLTMAANLLNRRHTWALAALTAVCYSLLFAVGGDSVMPVHGGDVGAHVHGGNEEGTAFSQHLFGMWVVFLVSAALVAHYVSSLATAVRERDRKLALAREEALRSERIVALGTLGAGAAHDLGTPLTTIGILAEEIAQRQGGAADVAADVALLQGEVARCKGILNALTRATGAMRGEGGAAQAADAFLNHAMDRWLIMRPTVAAEARWTGSPVPALMVDQTLEQALLNLLNNAAEASPAGIEVTGRAEGDEVVIDIVDHGPGMTEEVERRAGELYFTTKAPEGGMGIGLFLANATIERFGGSVSLFNRAEGGCCTRVKLPAVLPTETGVAK